MSYNPSTGIVQDTGANDGVSIRDVQRALGVSSPDLYTLARSGNIKRLSPYKPIRGDMNGYSDKPGVMSDTDIINRNLGFLLPTFPFTKSGTTWNFESVIRGIANDNNVPWNTTPSASDTNTRGSIGNGWVYNMPIVNTHFVRLTDFNNYCNQHGNSYESTTFEVLEGTKNIYSGGSFTAKFFVKMSPLAPRNFKTLSGMHLGVAIIVPTSSSSVVLFYIGTGSSDFSVISTNAMGVAECSVIIPSTLFTEVIRRCTGQVDLTLNVVGFFAPASYSGYQNILSTYSGYQSNPNSMNGLIPVPGLDTDIIIWHPSSTSLCYLNIIGSGSIITPGTTTTTMMLRSVINTYNNTDAFNFYASQVKFTYDILDTNNNVVYSLAQKAQFGNSTDVINVKNTSAGSHTTVDLEPYNITQTLSLPNQSYSVDGYRVCVYLWYLAGVNPTTGSDSDWKISNQFFIKIGTPSPLD